MIALFEKADVKGINAVDYDGSRWDARPRALSAACHDDRPGRVRRRGEQLAHALHLRPPHRPDQPAQPPFELDIESKKYYLPKLLTEIRDGRPGAILSQIEPPYPEYRRLQRALATYRQLAAESATSAAA